MTVNCMTMHTFVHMALSSACKNFFTHKVLFLIQDFRTKITYNFSVRIYHNNAMSGYTTTILCQDIPQQCYVRIYHNNAISGYTTTMLCQDIPQQCYVRIYHNNAVRIYHNNAMSGYTTTMLHKVHIQGDKLFIIPLFQFAPILLADSNSVCCELYLTIWHTAVSKILVLSWWLLT